MSRLIESGNFLPISRVSGPSIGSLLAGLCGAPRKHPSILFTPSPLQPFTPPALHPSSGQPVEGNPFADSSSREGCLVPSRRRHSSSDLSATLKQDVRSHGVDGGDKGWMGRKRGNPSCREHHYGGRIAAAAGITSRMR